MDFGRIWGGFLEDFGEDLEVQAMIRATKGKSMDGWMDRVDLIICIALWTVQKLQGPLISNEARAVPIASRNRLRWRLFFFAFRFDLGVILGLSWGSSGG